MPEPKRIQRKLDEVANSHEAAVYVPPAFADFNGTWIRVRPLAVQAFFAGDQHPDAITIVSLENGHQQRVAMPVAEFVTTLDAALHGRRPLTENTT